MKKVAVLLFLLTLCVLNSLSARTFEVPEAATTQNTRVDLPWFFPEGVISTQDPVEQIMEYDKYLVATDFCMQGRGFALFQDPRNIKVKTNTKSTSSVTNPNTNMEIILDGYIETSSGIRVTTFCEQRTITQDQKNTVSNYLIKTANEAADIMFGSHKNLRDGAIQSLSEQFAVSVEELKKRFPEKDSSGITFQELYGIPSEMKRSDFVPRELHLGYMPDSPGILGAAYLNTGLVYYNPQGVILDYLKGKPYIFAHEFVHTNSNLQKFPFADGFNAEFYASQPMLLPEDKVSFFFHGYLGEARKASKVFFSFDFEQARREIIKLNLGGNLIIDEKKYRDYFEKQEIMKKELSTVLPRGMEIYFSNSLWWSAFNELLRDPTVTFKMLMAQNFDPTLLGGREKTMKWYELNKDLIKQVSKEALAALNDNSSGDPANSARIPTFALDFYNKSFNEDEKTNLRDYVSKNPKIVEIINEMKAEDAFKLLKTIGRGGAQ